MARNGETWELDGRDVRVTNLDKVFWPEEGLTKGDLLRYYRVLAPTLLPYMQDRPFTMRAWPNGIEGKNFYRWRVPEHAPQWLERFTYHLQTSNRTAEMAVVDELPELIWIANQGVIELHPWFATRHDVERPTWMVFDLDPMEGMDFGQVLQVGAWIHEMLVKVGVTATPKTSGGDGLHLFVPLQPRHTFEEVRAWMGRFIEWFEREHPGSVTDDKRFAEREGKVLIDYSQNAVGKSIVAPYSARAKPGARVSTPLSLNELQAGQIRPEHFTINTVPERLTEQGDLFVNVLTAPQHLPALKE